MGIKEYISKKQKEKNAPKYNIHSIEYAYTEDGSFVAPFVINKEATKVKDIETDKVVALKDGEYSQPNLHQALSTLFSIDADKIQTQSLLFMVEYFTYGTQIPGKIFKDVRSEILETGLAGDNRSTAINYGRIHYLTPTVYDLKPLTKQLSVNFEKRHRLRLEREAQLANVDENIKF